MCHDRQVVVFVEQGVQRGVFQPIVFALEEFGIQGEVDVEAAAVLIAVDEAPLNPQIRMAWGCGDSMTITGRALISSVFISFSRHPDSGGTGWNCGWSLYLNMRGKLVRKSWPGKGRAFWRLGTGSPFPRTEPGFRGCASWIVLAGIPVQRPKSTGTFAVPALGSTSTMSS